MASLLLGPVKRYLTDLLVSQLSHYIEGVQLEGLGFLGSDLVLNNVELRVEALNALLPPGAGLCLVRGFAKELRVHIPWTSLFSSPIELRLDTIECIMSPVANVGASSKTHTPASSVKSMDLISTPAKALKPGVSALPPPPATASALPEWLQSRITRIIANATVRVNNLIVKLVHGDAVLMTSLRSLTIASADPSADWAPGIVEPEGLFQYLHKTLTILDLTVTCDERSSSEGENYAADPPVRPPSRSRGASGGSEASSALSASGAHAAASTSYAARGLQEGERVSYLEEPLLSRTHVYVRARLPLDPRGGAAGGPAGDDGGPRGLLAYGDPDRDTLGSISRQPSARSLGSTRSGGEADVHREPGAAQSHVPTDGHLARFAARLRDSHEPSLSSLRMSDPFSSSTLDTFPGDMSLRVLPRSVGEQGRAVEPSSGTVTSVSTELPVTMVHVLVDAIEIGASARQVALLSGLVRSLADLAPKADAADEVKVEAIPASTPEQFAPALPAVGELDEEDADGDDEPMDMAAANVVATGAGGGGLLGWLWGSVAGTSPTVAQAVNDDTVDVSGEASPARDAPSPSGSVAGAGGGAEDPLAPVLAEAIVFNAMVGSLSCVLRRHERAVTPGAPHSSPSAPAALSAPVAPETPGFLRVPVARLGYVHVPLSSADEADDAHDSMGMGAAGRDDGSVGSGSLAPSSVRRAPGTARRKINLAPVPFARLHLDASTAHVRLVRPQRSAEDAGTAGAPPSAATPTVDLLSPGPSFDPYLSCCEAFVELGRVSLHRWDAARDAAHAGHVTALKAALRGACAPYAVPTPGPLRQQSSLGPSPSPALGPRASMLLEAAPALRRNPSAGSPRAAGRRSARSRGESIGYPDSTGPAGECLCDDPDVMDSECSLLSIGSPGEFNGMLEAVDLEPNPYYRGSMFAAADALIQGSVDAPDSTESPSHSQAHSAARSAQSAASLRASGYLLLPVSTPDQAAMAAPQLLGVAPFASGARVIAATVSLDAPLSPALLRELSSFLTAAGLTSANGAGKAPTEQHPIKQLTTPRPAVAEASDSDHANDETATPFVLPLWLLRGEAQPSIQLEVLLGGVCCNIPPAHDAASLTTRVGYCLDVRGLSGKLSVGPHEPSSALSVARYCGGVIADFARLCSPDAGGSPPVAPSSSFAAALERVTFSSTATSLHGDTMGSTPVLDISELRATAHASLVGLSPPTAGVAISFGRVLAHASPVVVASLAAVVDGYSEITGLPTSTELLGAYGAVEDIGITVSVDGARLSLALALAAVPCRELPVVSADAACSVASVQVVSGAPDESDVDGGGSQGEHGHGHTGSVISWPSPAGDTPTCQCLSFSASLPELPLDLAIFSALLSLVPPFPIGGTLAPLGHLRCAISGASIDLALGIAHAAPAVACIRSVVQSMGQASSYEPLPFDDSRSRAASVAPPAASFPALVSVAETAVVSLDIKPLVIRWPGLSPEAPSFELLTPSLHLAPLPATPRSGKGATELIHHRTVSMQWRATDLSLRSVTGDAPLAIPITSLSLIGKIKLALSAPSDASIGIQVDSLDAKVSAASLDALIPVCALLVDAVSLFPPNTASSIAGQPLHIVPPDSIHSQQAAPGSVTIDVRHVRLSVTDSPDCCSETGLAFSAQDLLVLLSRDQGGEFQALVTLVSAALVHGALDEPASSSLLSLRPNSDGAAWLKLVLSGRGSQLTQISASLGTTRSTLDVQTVCFLSALRTHAAASIRTLHGLYHTRSQSAQLRPSFALLSPAAARSTTTVHDAAGACGPEMAVLAAPLLEVSTGALSFTLRSPGAHLAASVGGGVHLWCRDEPSENGDHLRRLHAEMRDGCLALNYGDGTTAVTRLLLRPLSATSGFSLHLQSSEAGAASRSVVCRTTAHLTSPGVEATASDLHTLHLLWGEVTAAMGNSLDASRMQAPHLQPAGIVPASQPASAGFPGSPLELTGHAQPPRSLCFVSESWLPSIASVSATHYVDVHIGPARVGVTLDGDSPAPGTDPTMSAAMGTVRATGCLVLHRHVHPQGGPVPGSQLGLASYLVSADGHGSLASVDVSYSCVGLGETGPSVHTALSVAPHAISSASHPHDPHHALYPAVHAPGEACALQLTCSSGGRGGSVEGEVAAPPRALPFPAVLSSDTRLVLHLGRLSAETDVQLVGFGTRLLQRAGVDVRGLGARLLSPELSEQQSQPASPVSARAAFSSLSSSPLAPTGGSAFVDLGTQASLSFEGVSDGLRLLVSPASDSLAHAACDDALCVTVEALTASGSYQQHYDDRQPGAERAYPHRNREVVALRAAVDARGLQCALQPRAAARSRAAETLALLEHPGGLSVRLLLRLLAMPVSVAGDEEAPVRPASVTLPRAAVGASIHALSFQVTPALVQRAHAFGRACQELLPSPHAISQPAASGAPHSMPAPTFPAVAPHLLYLSHMRRTLHSSPAFAAPPQYVMPDEARLLAATAAASGGPVLLPPSPLEPGGVLLCDFARWGPGLPEGSAEKPPRELALVGDKWGRCGATDEQRRLAMGLSREDLPPPAEPPGPGLTHPGWWVPLVWQLSAPSSLAGVSANGPLIVPPSFFTLAGGAPGGGFFSAAAEAALTHLSCILEACGWGAEDDVATVMHGQPANTPLPESCWVPVCSFRLALEVQRDAGVGQDCSAEAPPLADLTWLPLASGALPTAHTWRLRWRDPGIGGHPAADGREGATRSHTLFASLSSTLTGLLSLSFAWWGAALHAHPECPAALTAASLPLLCATASAPQLRVSVRDASGAAFCSASLSLGSRSVVLDARVSAQLALSTAHSPLAVGETAARRRKAQRLPVVCLTGDTTVRAASVTVSLSDASTGLSSTLMEAAGVNAHARTRRALEPQPSVFIGAPYESLHVGVSSLDVHLYHRHLLAALASASDYAPVLLPRPLAQLRLSPSYVVVNLSGHELAVRQAGRGEGVAVPHSSHARFAWADPFLRYGGPKEASDADVHHARCVQFTVAGPPTAGGAPVWCAPVPVDVEGRAWQHPVRLWRAAAIPIGGGPLPECPLLVDILPPFAPLPPDSVTSSSPPPPPSACGTIVIRAPLTLRNATGLPLSLSVSGSAGGLDWRHAWGGASSSADQECSLPYVAGDTLVLSVEHSDPGRRGPAQVTLLLPVHPPPADTSVPQPAPLAGLEACGVQVLRLPWGTLVCAMRVRWSSLSPAARCVELSVSHGARVVNMTQRPLSLSQAQGEAVAVPAEGRCGLWAAESEVRACNDNVDEGAKGESAQVDRAAAGASAVHVLRSLLVGGGDEGRTRLLVTPSLPAFPRGGAGAADPCGAPSLAALLSSRGDCMHAIVHAVASSPSACSASQLVALAPLRVISRLHSPVLVLLGDTAPPLLLRHGSAADLSLPVSSVTAGSGGEAWLHVRLACGDSITGDPAFLRLPLPSPAAAAQRTSPHYVELASGTLGFSVPVLATLGLQTVPVPGEKAHPGLPQLTLILAPWASLHNDTGARLRVSSLQLGVRGSQDISESGPEAAVVRTAETHLEPGATADALVPTGVWPALPTLPAALPLLVQDDAGSCAVALPRCPPPQSTHCEGALDASRLLSAFEHASASLLACGPTIPHHQAVRALLQSTEHPHRVGGMLRVVVRPGAAGLASTAVMLTTDARPPVRLSNDTPSDVHVRLRRLPVLPPKHAAWVGQALQPSEALGGALQGAVAQAQALLPRGGAGQDEACEMRCAQGKLALALWLGAWEQGSGLASAEAPEPLPRHPLRCSTYIDSPSEHVTLAPGSQVPFDWLLMGRCGLTAPQSSLALPDGRGAVPIGRVVPAFPGVWSLPANADAAGDTTMPRAGGAARFLSADLVPCELSADSSALRHLHQLAQFSVGGGPWTEPAWLFPGTVSLHSGSEEVAVSCGFEASSLAVRVGSHSEVHDRVSPAVPSPLRLLAATFDRVRVAAYGEGHLTANSLSHVTAIELIGVRLDATQSEVLRAKDIRLAALIGGLNIHVSGPRGQHQLLRCPARLSTGKDQRDSIHLSLQWCSFGKQPVAAQAVALAFPHCAIAATDLDVLAVRSRFEPVYSAVSLLQTQYLPRDGDPTMRNRDWPHERGEYLLLDFVDFSFGTLVASFRWAGPPLPIAISFSGVPVRISPFKARRAMLLAPQLAKELLAHVIADAVICIPAVIGSSELLGNPAGFVRALSEGLVSALEAPFNEVHNAQTKATSFFAKLAFPIVALTSATKGVFDGLVLVGAKVAYASTSSIASLATSIGENFSFNEAEFSGSAVSSVHTRDVFFIFQNDYMAVRQIDSGEELAIDKFDRSSSVRLLLAPVGSVFRAIGELTSSVASAIQDDDDGVRMWSSFDMSNELK